MWWGLDKDISEQNGQRGIQEFNLRRAFDFIITLEELVLRDNEL
jgi:hypothetical protein